MKISIACDHGGFDLKNFIIDSLKEKYDFIDHGCFNKDSIDYPDFGKLAALDVKDKKADFGIVICTTGIGMSITANKVKGIRCALCTNTKMAEMTRLHNDANMLALGANNQSFEEALNITKVFLMTNFSNEERHIRRIQKIKEMEGRD